MNSNNQTIEELKKYVEKGYFSPELYERLVIIPNNHEVCRKIEEVLNSCINEIIATLQNESGKKLIKDLLKKGLNRFDKMQYDTEDMERY